MPGMSGIALVEHLRAVEPELNVIVITAFEDMETAVGAIRAGAYDYLVKPLDLDQIELVLERALRDRTLRQRVRQRTEDEGAAVALSALVGRTPAMIEVYKRIGAVALNRAPVLIRGETGSGKEVIARAIHYNSPPPTSPSSPSTARPCRKRSSSRSCSDTYAARSPEPWATGAGASSWRGRGRFSSTRSAMSPPRSRPSSCASSKSGSSTPWAAGGHERRRPG
jgi:hypothetical protein